MPGGRRTLSGYSDSLSDETPPVDPSDRRRRPTLREVLDELIDHVRGVARNSRSMSEEEFDYAQQRLIWLAEEVWRLAVEEKEESIE